MTLLLGALLDVHEVEVFRELSGRDEFLANRISRRDDVINDALFLRNGRNEMRLEPRISPS